MAKQIDRTGETAKANNNQTMTIVEYINYNNIIVEFDDGTRVKTYYKGFKKGEVKNPNYVPHIGETRKATNGQTITIVEYINCNHVIVEFDDEQKTRAKTSYNNFKKGYAKNPNYTPHIGETRKATNGQTMTVVEYINNKTTIVEFDDEQKTHVKTSYYNFKKGHVLNPNSKDSSYRCFRNKHIGEKSVASNGQIITIVEYIGAIHIIVEFDDKQKTRVKTSYYCFKRGAVSNPNYVPHIGETCKANNGQIMTILEYIDCNNIIVEFDDEAKTRVKTTYTQFKRGTVKNPNLEAQKRLKRSNEHIGKISVASNGQTMTIVEYINARHVIVEFDDKQKTRVKTSYERFIKGTVRNPTFEAEKRIKQHIGNTSVATNGQTMTIVEYINYNNIIVEFDDGTRVKTSNKGLKNGSVKNPCFPMLGKGAYKTFQTIRAYTAPDGKVYFYCECQQCGFKANLTVNEIIKLDHDCWKSKDSVKVM